MLSGDAPSRIDARPHDLDHRLVHPLALGWIVGAVRNVGVKISIAGVKDIAHHDAVLLADGVNRS